MFYFELPDEPSSWRPSERAAALNSLMSQIDSPGDQLKGTVLADVFINRFVIPPSIGNIVLDALDITREVTIASFGEDEVIDEGEQSYGELSLTFMGDNVRTWLPSASPNEAGSFPAKLVATALGRSSEQLLEELQRVGASGHDGRLAVGISGKHLFQLRQEETYLHTAEIDRVRIESPNRLTIRGVQLVDEILGAVELGEIGRAIGTLY